MRTQLKLKLVPNHSKRPPIWAFLFLIANGLLLATVAVLLLRGHRLTTPQANASAAQSSLLTIPSLPELGPRHQLNYDQWVSLLQQEAEVIANNQPERLAVLAGDSLSLWFPPDLLPTELTWLNQGISGETSAGLLQRLDLFDRTQPEVIFVMIGINDLIRGVRDETVLANQQLVIEHLKEFHPKAQIVVQSILPHGAEHATWEGKAKLLAISNDRIRKLNERLETIAKSEEVHYLNLHPLFIDADGNMRSSFSTDGLHLSSDGYLVWRSALQLYSQLELER